MRVVELLETLDIDRRVVSMLEKLLETYMDGLTYVPDEKFDGDKRSKHEVMEVVEDEFVDELHHLRESLIKEYVMRAIFNVLKRSSTTHHWKKGLLSAIDIIRREMPELAPTADEQRSIARSINAGQ